MDCVDDIECTCMIGCFCCSACPCCMLCIANSEKGQTCHQIMLIAATVLGFIFFIAGLSDIPWDLATSGPRGLYMTNFIFYIIFALCSLALVALRLLGLLERFIKICVMVLYALFLLTILSLIFIIANLGLFCRDFNRGGQNNMDTSVSGIPGGVMITTRVSSGEYFFAAFICTFIIMDDLFSLFLYFSIFKDFRKEFYGCSHDLCDGINCDCFSNSGNNEKKESSSSENGKKNIPGNGQSNLTNAQQTPVNGNNSNNVMIINKPQNQNINSVQINNNESSSGRNYNNYNNNGQRANIKINNIEKRSQDSGDSEAPPPA